MILMYDRQIKGLQHESFNQSYFICFYTNRAPCNIVKDTICIFVYIQMYAEFVLKWSVDQ